MYNPSRVIDALFGRVGWRQPTQPEYAILTEPNTLTKSGRYFQNSHWAVTIENIKATQPDADISDADFNLLLEEIQTSSILRTMTDIFDSPEVVDCVQTYDREDNEPDIRFIANTGKFVGWKITLAKTPEYVAALSSIALYFDTDVEFELKCFVENKKDAIWTKVVKAIGGEETIVPIDDLVLSYLGNQTRTTAFYIGYFQDDLGEAKAFNEYVRNYWSGCLWRAEAFSANVANNKPVLPIHQFTSDTYGMNLQFTSYKDHTNVIVAQPQIFDEAVSLQVACNVLEMILSTNRSNGIERLSGEKMAEIYRSLNQQQFTEESPVGPGLKARYETEINKIRKSFFGFPKIETHSLPYAVYQDTNLRY